MFFSSMAASWSPPPPLLAPSSSTLHPSLFLHPFQLKFNPQRSRFVAPPTSRVLPRLWRATDERQASSPASGSLCRQTLCKSRRQEDAPSSLRNTGILLHSFTPSLKSKGSVIARAQLAGAGSSQGSGGLRPVHFYRERVLPLLSQVTPLLTVKWAAITAVTVAILRQIFKVLSYPTLWVYSSWFFSVWPWPAAVALGIWTLAAAFRQSKSKAKEWEQLMILAGALVWLVLVPLGHFNGYVDGWPLVLFSLYMFFFLISSVIRIRLYGELSPRSQDKQWASTPSRIAQIAFIIAVVVGHWLAAYEAPRLFFSWNWDWPSRIAVAVLTLAVVVHYNATYYLGKYFDRLVKPRTVVTFGPYRWVRHPIYSSYMLLFAGYCLALRAYWSMAFLLFACLLYYELRVKLEEDMLVEAFGELYTSYRDRVTKRYLPFLY